MKAGHLPTAPVKWHMLQHACILAVPAVAGSWDLAADILAAPCCSTLMAAACVTSSSAADPAASTSSISTQDVQQPSTSAAQAPASGANLPQVVPQLRKRIRPAAAASFKAPRPRLLEEASGAAPEPAAGDSLGPSQPQERAAAAPTDKPTASKVAAAPAALPAAGCNKENLDPQSPGEHSQPSASR